MKRVEWNWRMSINWRPIVPLFRELHYHWHQWATGRQVT